MKPSLILILSLLVPFLTFGQKWHLAKFDADKEYKYEYWFNFQNEKDTNSVDLKIIPNRSIRKIQGVITDTDNEKIPFANVEIRDLNQTVLSIGVTNYKGEFSLDATIEDFLVHVVSLGYDTLTLKVSLKSNQEADLKIKLGKGPEDSVYQINSVKELTPTEINEIINCVASERKKKRAHYMLNCSSENKFTISLQI